MQPGRTSKKRGRWISISIAGLLLATAILNPGCSKASPEGPQKKKFAATIFPLFDIARNIGGDKIDVIEILPPGASPHTYELTPKQVKQLQGVLVVFSIGHGLDNWVDSLVDTLPGVRKVVVDKGIPLRTPLSTAEKGQHEHEGADHRHEEVDPHYWLSVANGKIIATNVAQEIISADQLNEDYYRGNLETYLASLDNLEKDIAKRINSLSKKEIITFHDAWHYFAEEFGLEIVGTFEPFPGKQPTPRYLAELQEKARRHNVSAVFSEPQLSSQTIESFVGDMGIKLRVLDPLGGTEGRDSYINLLRYNTDVIIEALSNE